VAKIQLDPPKFALGMVNCAVGVLEVGEWSNHNRSLSSLLQALCEKIMVAGLDIVFEKMFLKFLVHCLPDCQAVVVRAHEEMLDCFTVALV